MSNMKFIIFDVLLGSYVYAIFFLQIADLIKSMIKVIVVFCTHHYVDFGSEILSS